MKGSKEKKEFSACVFWLIEWLPGPGEILQLSVFLTEPLFWSLLFDGGLQRVWHPAKCLRLAATLEAVIMARRCLAAQASASPLCTDILFLRQGGAATEPLLALWERSRWPAVILVTASNRWMVCTVWLHFSLHTITTILVLWSIAQLETHIVKWFSVLQPTLAVMPAAYCMCLVCQKLSLLSLQICHRVSCLNIYIPTLTTRLGFCIIIFTAPNVGSWTERHLPKLHLRMWMDGRQFGAQTVHHQRGINHLRFHY